MIRKIARGSAIAALVLAAAVTAGCASIKVADGQKMPGGKNTVFGKIEVGNDASVGGPLTTSNGSVVVGNNSRTKNISTKRGNIGVGTGATIEGSLSTGLGDVIIGEKSEVTGGITSENGTVTVREGCTIGGSLRATSHISVTGSTVEGNIYSSQGNIDLVDSHIKGGVNLERSTNVIADGGQKLTLGRDVVVEGPIKVSGNVRVLVHKSARAKGGITGVDPEPFE